MASPHGDSTAVAFIYGDFGLAIFESTPHIAVRACLWPPCYICFSVENASYPIPIEIKLPVWYYYNRP